MLFIQKILLISLILTLDSYSKTMEEINNNLKATYIYNIVNYITKQGTTHNKKTFNICTQNRINLYTSLQKFENTTIQNKNIHIYNITKDIGYINYCNMIILPKLSDKKLKSIIQKARQENIITLSDIPNCATKGVMIYLKDASYKITFEMNLKELRKADIKISSRLLKLSKIVEK